MPDPSPASNASQRPGGGAKVPAAARANPAAAPSVAGSASETAGIPPQATPPAAGFAPPAAVGEVGTLGPYRVLKQLGKGGMGAVFLALDTRLNRKLALKVMLPQFAADRSARERFLREARAAAQVQHDNVLTVYEADERDGVPYIAMQLLQGYPLDEYLRRKGRPAIPQVLRIGREAAEGLAAAHALGLVHRDIKPGNLWLEAPNGRVKVLDFGLAKPVDADIELTKSGAVVGTPAYMSPEQAGGQKVDHRSDLFSLGAVLYYLTTGQLPFQGATVMAVLMALGNREPVPVAELNPDAPGPLAELIHQLLAKDPARRPRGAEEVAARLRAMEGVPAAGTDPHGPQVVAVPVQVTALPGQSVFADLDAGPPAELDRARREKPKPRRARSGGAGLWVAAGVATLVALAAVAGVVIYIKNKDGSETKIEVPDGATVTVKDKGGKTLAQVKPGAAKPAPAPAAPPEPERRRADYVLSVGGSVAVHGNPREYKPGDTLPDGSFNLSLVMLRGNRNATDAGLAVFDGCRNLHHLDLVNTLVGDAGVAHFGGCKDLRILDLAGAPLIGDEGLAHFSGSRSIQHLWLWNTGATDKGVEAFKDCKNLINLDLRGTKVTDAGLENFKGCRNLGGLHLGGTPVTDRGLAVFKDCKNLSLLLVYGTAVTDDGLKCAADFPQLAILNVSDTKVTDAGLAHLKGCKALRELGAHNAKVGDAGLEHLKELTGITNLDLSNTAITDAGLAHLKGLKALTGLAINDTAVTDAGLEHLAGLMALTVLNLSGTKVTDAGVEFLFKGKQLKDVDLRKTRVTRKTVDALRKAYPECKIHWDGE